VILPTKPRAVPEPTIEGDSFLAFGAPKSGKTYLTTGWDDCLVIDCEGGARKAGGLIVDVLALAREEGRTPLNVLRSIVVELHKDCPYDAVALDTLDEVSKWMEKEAVAKVNVKHNRDARDLKRPPYTDISDPEYGAGYAEHRNLVMGVVDTFKALPCTKIFVAHSKHMTTDEDGTITRTIDLPGKLAHWVAAAVDHLGMTRIDPEHGYVIDFCGYDVSTSQGARIQQAGSRLPQLNNRIVGNSKDAITAAVASRGVDGENKAAAAAASSSE